MKNYSFKFSALLLLMAWLGIVQQAAAASATTPMVLEATSFYGKDYTPSNTTNTTNTWSTYTNNNKYGTCTTTANGVTITSNNMTVNSSNFKVETSGSFTISVSSGAIYRIVIKANDGPQKYLGISNGIWEGSNTWVCGSSWWGFTKGKSSVTFTNNLGDNYQINSINVYTYRTASSSEASISQSSFTVTKDQNETQNVTLTTSLGPFDGASSPYDNALDVTPGTSSSDLELDGASASSYTNGSSIDIEFKPHEAGSYTGDITLGKQTSSNTADNYHMLAIWLPFSITVVDCSRTPTVAFTNAGPINKTIGDASFTNAATVKYYGTSTGQIITYTSSDTDVATVSSTGQVTLGSKLGSSTTITASVESDGTNCSAQASYTLNLSGYSITYHYPTCAESQPENATNVSGTVSLPTNMSVDGYRFAGWTTAAVTGSNVTTVSPLYTSSVSVSGNLDLYAVYTKTSSTFTLMDKNSTLTEGEYVFAGSYSQGVTYIMTANLVSSSHKISANTTDYSVTAAKTLSCQEEACIWTISGSAGYWVVRNNSTGKYLSAISGDASNSNLCLNLVDEQDAYSVWTIAQGTNKVPFTCTNNKRSSDSENRYSMMGNGTYFGFYSNGTSPYLFKRESSSGTYTSNPDCDATEYTVTISSVTGGSASAEASANGSWSSPVLSGLHGSETVTLTATPATGYQFSSWTVVSGSVTLSSTSTSPATFTMPTNNVVVRPNFTPQNYTITYKDKDNATFSGSPASPMPSSYDYGTGCELPEVTKTDYIFMGWFAESNCSGTRVNSVSTTDYGNKTFYALWMQLTDYRAWCPEPTVSLTGDDVYVTGTYRTDGAVMAVNQLTLNATNLVPGSTVRLSTPAGSGVYFTSERGANFTKSSKPTATLTITANASGAITDQVIYIHYLPAAQATAGATATPQDITVTATYQELTSLTQTQDVHVRNMPAQFVIATKVGGSWFALPADMTAASNPAGVLLDVDETTWTARGPSTLAYTLWPVKTTNTAQDQYETAGDSLRFANSSDNKALWANNASSGTDIKVDAAISSLGMGADAQSYKWGVTTAVDGTTWKYNLQTNQSNNTRYLNYSSGKWGTYASGNNDLYLIPLTVVETASITVMEWGETEVALKCASGTTLTSVAIDGTTVSPAPTLTTLTGDIMRLSGLPNLSTLGTYAMKKMVVNVTESSTAKQFVTTIPFILTSSNSSADGTPKTAIDLRNFAAGSSQEARNAVIRVVDVVVRNGAQLNVTTASGEGTACTFNDLYIYPGGKVNITDNDLNVQNVYLRGGFSWLELPNKNENNYRLPQLKVTDGKSINGIGSSGNGIYYDFYGDNRIYYMIAIPRTLQLRDITNEENTGAFKAWIKRYDGSRRINDPEGNDWVALTKNAEQVERGIGYELAVRPPSNRSLGILRFPLFKNTAWQDEEDCQPQVVAWGMEGYNAIPRTVNANNVGWNFMGNPFFSAFTNSDYSKIVTKGLSQHIENGKWNGSYDWVESEVKYFTIPSKVTYDYTDVRAKDYKLDAFYPFFVQVSSGTRGEPATLSFASSSRSFKMPMKYLSALKPQEINIDLELLNDNGDVDIAGFNVDDDYSANFDMDDKEKTIDLATARLKLYTVMDGFRIAFNSLPEKAFNDIPLGYITNHNGYMTISLKEMADLKYIDQLLLTDHEEQRTVNLMYRDYSFYTNAMTEGNDTRFTISLTLKRQEEVVTTVDEGSPLSDVCTYTYDKTLIIHGLPLGSDVWVYDMTGKLLYRTDNSEQRIELGLPVGVYNVRVISGNEATTLKAFVK